MKTRWKKVMALLGMSAMLVCQNGVFVLADSMETVVEDVDSDTNGDEDAGEGANGDANTDGDADKDVDESTDTDIDANTDETTDPEESENTISPLSDEASENADVEISDGLVAATDLHWSDEMKGQAVFTFNTTSALKYSLIFYKDGEKIDTMSGTKAASEGSVVRTWNSHMEINDDGAVYTFRIKTYDIDTAEPDFDLTTGLWSDLSPEYTYNKPSEKVKTPSNIKWDSTGKVTWDAVDNVWRYAALLYRSKEGEDNYSFYAGKNTTSTEWSFASSISEGYNYYVKVRAYSNNIEEYANGDLSERIPFNQSNNTAVDNANSKLESAIGSSSNVTTQEKVAAVKTAFEDTTAKEELQIAMQTDESTQEKIKSLEDSYMQAMGLETETKVESLDEDLGIDTDSVSILGAALNATEAGKVTFNLSMPDEDTQKKLIESNTQFTKAIVLDLSLDGAGIQKGQDLAIPVTVTMSAPAGIAIDKLTVLHYNADNTSYETLTVRENSDKTISFTVTHFSNFVFAEKETASSNISNNGNGSSSDESNSSDDEASSSSSSVAATPVKQPTIGTSKGWSAVSSEVDKAIAKLTAGDTTPAIVSVNLNGVETIPATAISAIAGKNVVLSIVADANTLITIDGSQLTALDASDVKLISKKDADGKTTLNVRTQNLNLEKSIVVYSNVGIDKAGSVATLYFENADNSLLEFRTSPVFENGYAAFITPFVNANYIISTK